MATRILVTLALLTLATAQTPDSQCFWKRDRTVIAEGDSWYPCNNTATHDGGAQLCCIKGSQCGPNSLCHYPTGNNGGSGWYLGGCTDGSWNDPVCTKTCTRFKNTWVQYNNTAQNWTCCGDDICNGNLTSVTFNAVAPDSWAAVPSAATSTSSAPSRTPTGGAAAGSNNNGNNGRTEQNKDSGGLSTGAQAGIGVGVGIVGLAAIAGIAFWFLRKRKRSSAQSGSSDAEQQKQAPVYGGHQAERSPAPAYNQSTQEHKKPGEQNRQMSELPSEGVYPPQELGSERPVAELPGDDSRK